MIKAIIFDFFGVICSDEFWNLIKEDKQVENTFSQLADQINLGKMSWRDFVAQIASDKGISASEVEGMFEAEAINPQMVLFIQNLQKKYKTALLTNASASIIRPMLEDKGMDKIFSQIIVSSDYGVVKPDPKIFQIALAKLQVKPEEAVFIDDISRYVYAAKELGIHGIIYHDFGQMKTELARLLAPGADH